MNIHPCHKEELIKKVEKLVSHWNSEPGKVISRIHGNEFNDFVESLYKKFSHEHLSKSTIESESISFLDNIIKNKFSKHEDILNELDLLITRLEEKINLWEMILPIDNIVLSNLEYVDMGSGKLAQFSQISGEVSNGVSRSDLIDTTKTFLAKHIENIRDKVCASIEVSAEDANKYQLALIEYENIINLLRIYFSYHMGVCTVKIGLCEDFLAQIILLSFRKDESGIWGAELTNTRFREEHEITPELLQDWKENYYFNEVKSILRKSSRSEIDRQILLAIRWIGSGIHEEIDYDKIIKFTIALECLLISGKNKDAKSKKESLAERCSFLLEEDDSAKRYQRYLEIKGRGDENGLYDIRSNVVHGGEVVIDPRHVDGLGDLAIRCLFKVISLSSREDMREIQDIIDWVDKSKMRCYYGIGL